MELVTATKVPGRKMRVRAAILVQVNVQEMVGKINSTPTLSWKNCPSASLARS